MSNTNQGLIAKINTMIKQDYNGKKGHLSDNIMFKYCKFYTGDFWQKLKIHPKAA